MQLGDRVTRTFFIDTAMPVDFVLSEWRDFQADVERLLEEVRQIQMGTSARPPEVVSDDRPRRG